jgi:integrase/recombinase XerD
MTTEAITPLRQRMIEDMNARKLCAGTQRGHIRSCKRFAAFLKRSPDTAILDDIRWFQLHLAETGVSICTRNCIMTGLRFLLRVTLRRLDLAEEVYHLREPEKLPLVMSIDEIKRLLAVGSSLKTRVLLSLGYGCGLRASEIVRLKVKHIDKAQKIILIEQSKGRKDRNVMLTKAGGGGITTPLHRNGLRPSPQPTRGGSKKSVHGQGYRKQHLPEVQEVQEVPLSWTFCTFCTFCTAGSEQLRIRLPPMLGTPGCWCAGLSKPPCLLQSLEEILRLIGVQTLAQGLSAGIL